MASSYGQLALRNSTKIVMACVALLVIIVWLDDCVLVDGRFRVCCFLTSLKNAEQGTRIIFDDYVY